MRWLIWTHLVAALCGLLLGASITNSSLPSNIEIIKNGESKGYAMVNVENSIILNVSEGDNPGAYLAFLIYAPKDQISQALT